MNQDLMGARSLIIARFSKKAIYSWACIPVLSLQSAPFYNPAKVGFTARETTALYQPEN